MQQDTASFCASGYFYQPNNNQINNTASRKI